MSHIYPEASVYISEIIYFGKFSYPTVLVQNVKNNILKNSILGKFTLLKQCLWKNIKNLQIWKCLHVHMYLYSCIYTHMHMYSCWRLKFTDHVFSLTVIYHENIFILTVPFHWNTGTSAALTAAEEVCGHFSAHYISANSAVGSKKNKFAPIEKKPHTCR